MRQNSKSQYEIAESLQISSQINLAGHQYTRSKYLPSCCGCNCCSVALLAGRPRRTSACQWSQQQRTHARARSKWLLTGQATHLPAARDKQSRAPPWRPHGGRRRPRRAASDRRDALPRGPPPQLPFAAAAAATGQRGSEDEEDEGVLQRLPLPPPPPPLRAAPLAPAPPARSGPSAAAPPCTTHLPLRPPLHVQTLKLE